jgi:hypothetical protein
MTNSGPIGIALVSKFPGRRECIARGLEHYGVNVLIEGSSPNLGYLEAIKPAVLLLDPEELIRRADELSVLLLGMRVASPETKIVLRADLSAESPLGRICTINELSVAPTSMDWRELAQSIRNANDGSGAFLEAKKPLLEGSSHQHHGYDRGRRR